MDVPPMIEVESDERRDATSRLHRNVSRARRALVRARTIGYHRLQIWNDGGELQDGGNTFHLRMPIHMDLAQEDGMWRCESSSLGIVAAGSSQEAALHSFTEDFGVLWREIAQAPDIDLTDDAMRLKHALHNLVKSVDVAA
jgi:hypothetical protein